MSGAEIASDVAAALAEAGEATGNGPLIGTLYRRGKALVSEHSPTYTDPTPYSVTLVIEQYTLREQELNSVEQGDRKVTMSADGLAIVPDTEDWLEIGGVEYTIENVDSFEPGGVPLLYEIQARRSTEEIQYG